MLEHLFLGVHLPMQFSTWSLNWYNLKKRFCHLILGLFKKWSPAEFTDGCRIKCLSCRLTFETRVCVFWEGLKCGVVFFNLSSAYGSPVYWLSRKAIMYLTLMTGVSVELLTQKQMLHKCTSKIKWMHEDSRSVALHRSQLFLLYFFTVDRLIMCQAYNCKGLYY